MEGGYVDGLAMAVSSGKGKGAKEEVVITRRGVIGGTNMACAKAKDHT